MTRSEEPYVLLVVTGGIAAYKACDLVRELRRAGESVQVILTRPACAFVTPLTFESLSGRRVLVDLLPGVTDGAIDHIELGRQSKVVAVAPATADFLARLAAGMANDLATATLLALPKSVPVLLAPAMNQEMWTHPATQRNLASLRSFAGVHYELVDPVVKELACGEFGPGGLAEPAELCDAILSLSRSSAARARKRPAS